MEPIIQKFINEVYQKFYFLEEVYAYKKINCNVENQYYYPDSQVVVKYANKSVGIEVYWYFAGANIGVIFFELSNGEIPTKRFFWGDDNDASRAINLYTLARYLNQGGDKAFLLKDIDNVTISQVKKREKIIKENMSGIIDGLSYAVNNLATNIINGDTSVFQDVMRYQNELINNIYNNG